MLCDVHVRRAAINSLLQLLSNVYPHNPAALVIVVADGADENAVIWATGGAGGPQVCVKSTLHFLQCSRTVAFCTVAEIQVPSSA